MSCNPPVRPRTPQSEGKTAHRHLAHAQESNVTNTKMTTVQFQIKLLLFFFSPIPYLHLQGRQQQRGANPGGGQQERSAATALHASQGSVSPCKEDLEVWLRGVLCQV